MFLYYCNVGAIISNYYIVVINVKQQKCILIRFLVQLTYLILLPLDTVALHLKFAYQDKFEHF